MRGAWVPMRCLRRHLAEDSVTCRTLTAGHQPEDLHIQGQRPHVQRTKRRLGNTCSIVTEVIEFIVHRESDSFTARRFSKDQQISEQTCPISNRASSLALP